MDKKIIDKIKKISSKPLNIFNTLKLYNIFMKMPKEESIEYIKIFIDNYYNLEEKLPDEFYELIKNQLYSDNNYKYLFDIIDNRNIYSLISYLKHNNEDITGIDEYLTSLQYYLVPERHINKLIDSLKKLKTKDNNKLDESIKNNPNWLLRKQITKSKEEYKLLAYKIYLSIGPINGLELLKGKYGDINYEQIYYMFSNLNIKKNITKIEEQAFNNFIFGNKKDTNNIIYLMLFGKLPKIFINFDYLYNNINYFIDKIGTKMPRNKVESLLEERYLSKNILNPEVTSDIISDMISSYHHKYEYLDTSDIEIIKNNFDIYNKYLKAKNKSSIPRIKLSSKDSLSCEILKLNDPRNLVLGYRSGNCFRINGDASVLFHQFLSNPHIRILSISTNEYKDYAMMLIMRNGNVLIGQGIEVSNRVPLNIKGIKLYNICRNALKELMNYMNYNNDEIVATIIGSSNSNVSDYNREILPFIINPILENTNNYYNGISNYQCLLDLDEGKTLQDIKLYIPEDKYQDERSPILRRDRSNYSDRDNYRKIEKILISLRFKEMNGKPNIEYYNRLLSHNEIYTCCNTDWYITLFDDGKINSFVDNTDIRAQVEYETELQKIKINKSNVKKKKR